jgi:Fe-S-cluster containining protein
MTDSSPSRPDAAAPGDDPEALLRRLYERVDSFFARVRRRAGEALTCRSGCTDCCRVELSVFEIEARRIRRALLKLPGPQRAGIAERARAGLHCCMLDPTDGSCLIYRDRPLICRSHGLAVFDGRRVSHCPRNYTERPPERAEILNLEGINAPLALINRMAGGSGERVTLSSLAVAAAEARVESGAANPTRGPEDPPGAAE